MEESEQTKSSRIIVLNDKNLSDYRAWLKQIREKVRAEKGRLTEQHLIGELVPLTDTQNEDEQISGEMSGQSNGADDKRRRRIRHLGEYTEGAARNAACRAYGDLSIYAVFL